MLAIIVNNQRKQSFSLNIYTKVGGNLGSNLKKIMVVIFFPFGNFLATFLQSSERCSSILWAQSGI